MIRAPEILTPDDTAVIALEKMPAGGFRHLPVVCDGVICGMVSIGDFYDPARRMLQEELQGAESFICGEQYGHLRLAVRRHRLSRAELPPTLPLERPRLRAAPAVPGR